MSGFGKTWGSRNAPQTKRYGKDSTPFIDAEMLKKIESWQNVSITSAKDDFTKNDVPVFYIMFRELSGKFVHRQAFFEDRQLNRVLHLFDLDEGIDDDAEILGKELWVKFISHQPKGSDREFVKAVAFRLEHPTSKEQDKKDVPF